MASFLPRLRPALTPAALVLCSPALAHHPMGGQVPASALEGFLSGLGHPVIEPVHLLFLVGVAALAGLTRLPPRAAFALLVLYVLASVGATALGAADGSPVALQFALSASLLCVVPWLWIRRFPAAKTAAGIAVLAGAVHGLAFAEAVIGAEPIPFIAYMVGLAVVQSLLLAFACLAVGWLARRHPPHLPQVSRVLAGSLLAAGLVFAISAV